MYCGSSGDRYHEYMEDSTSHEVKSAYWKIRQAVICKLGKEEGRHVVASDAEQDGKLGVGFVSITLLALGFKINPKYLSRVEQLYCGLSLVHLW